MRDRRSNPRLIWQARFATKIFPGNARCKNKTPARRVRHEVPSLRHFNEAPQNRLNHREAIRRNPPNILITNFSMLEYLLERPVDASIFDAARLKFLVLDEIHAYRGVQSTEIAFLIRRLKDRLRVNDLCCIGTSATLGSNDDASNAKVRKFAADIFGTPFDEPNPIRGTPAKLILNQPSHCPKPADYVRAATRLREKPSANVGELFNSGTNRHGNRNSSGSLSSHTASEPQKACPQTALLC